ncbi:MAG: serine/threonine protein kinase [Myxococcaceae bacterium]|nr:serine/threonine protein kinase [Myxococcaceae bacterium]
MERSRPASRPPRLACVACSSPVHDERCGYCGAAQEAGGYRVLQVLSRSAHGAVYLAEDHAGGRVALKELVFSLVPSTQELDAFEREASLLRTLSHPALPRFREAFKHGEGVHTRLYLAQEYVPGLNLAGHLAITHFDEAQVLGYARQVLEVLAYLHSRSPPVVHRDVKPANLVVTTDGFLKLVDLGAAREIAPQGTHRSTLVGTFGYMAPEQLGGTVDARSDLYGLGATLVHLLTRRPPEQLLTPAHELDFSRHANVGPRTRQFLERLTAARPERRFDSAHQALAYLDGEEIEAPLTPRRFRLLGIAAGGVLAVAAGLASAFALSARQQHERVVVPTAPEARRAPATATPTLSRSREPAAHVPFSWRRAEWDLGRSNGPFLHDASRRGHDLEIPRTGHTQDFFGLKWDGTTSMAIADHPDFVVTNGPLLLSFHAVLWEGGESVLMERSAPDGALAWRLAMVGERRVRFTIGGGDGASTFIEGRLPVSDKGGTLDGFDLYASYDVRTGALELRDGCHLLASGTSSIVIAKRLGADARVTMLAGFKGVASRFSVENSRMVPGGTGCTLSGVDLGVSDD